MDRSNGGIPGGCGRCVQKSKREMVSVDTPHWGSNGTMSTEKVKLKRGPHHQQPGANGIHCAPPNFLPLDVATATHCDQGGKYHRRSMGTTRQHDIIHRSRPALEGGGLY